MENNQDSVVIRDIQSYTNELGVLNYNNSLILNKYKRFYIISHSSVDVVRAWQAHPQEGKCFIPVRGKFLVCWVEIDNFDNPSQTLKAESLILDSSEKRNIEIPKGYANGLKALEPDSEVMVFSEFSLVDSLEDNIRYDSNLWFNSEQYD
jgi:dTDP-4-dehydrorhamnose 3,5-epimerase